MWEDGKRQLIHGLPYIDRKRERERGTSKPATPLHMHLKKIKNQLLQALNCQISVHMEKSAATFRCSLKTPTCAYLITLIHYVPQKANHVSVK